MVCKKIVNRSSEYGCYGSGAGAYYSGAGTGDFHGFGLGDSYGYGESDCSGGGDVVCSGFFIGLDSRDCTGHG